MTRACAAVAGAFVLWVGTAAGQPVLPAPEPPFAGTLRQTLAGSTPEYPRPTRVPAGAPNMLVVLVDDTGFGNPSTFGGPARTRRHGRGHRRQRELPRRHTVPLRYSGYAGMDVGRDKGLPVSPGYYYYLRAPFPFAGTIERVEFELR